MAVFIVSSAITKREKVNPNVVLLSCKKHGNGPKIENVFTGRKQKFNGAIATCGFDECLCYSYDAETVAKKWNENQSK